MLIEGMKSRDAQFSDIDKAPKSNSAVLDVNLYLLKTFGYEIFVDYQGAGYDNFCDLFDIQDEYLSLWCQIISLTRVLCQEGI